eukprot:37524-Eustigmatos_ZCMA.PRE.1
MMCSCVAKNCRTNGMRRYGTVRYWSSSSVLRGEMRLPNVGRSRMCSTSSVSIERTRRTDQVDTSHLTDRMPCSSHV